MFISKLENIKNDSINNQKKQREAERIRIVQTDKKQNVIEAD